MLNFMEVHPEGKEAFTQFEQIHANEHFSLLRVQIKSGRTHQIRVPPQNIHHPIVGHSFMAKMKNTHYPSAYAAGSFYRRNDLYRRS